jgi:hypothetical protein
MNDLKGQYLEARQNSDLSPAKRRRALTVNRQEQSAPKKDSKGIAEAVGGIAGDIGSGIIETPRQIIGGARDAAQETIELAGSLGDWLDENVLDLGQLSDIGIGEEGTEPELPTVDEPRSTTGGLGS